MATFLSGCSFFGSPFPSVEKFKESKVVNPFFSIPPENQQDFEKRNWILLAESKNKNWYYDPYSIYEDEEGIISFDAFIAERGYEDRLPIFNSSSVGPFKQKIDCFGNYQWSEIFYAEHMPKQETFVNPLKPNLEWGWIKIKPNTSMAYIRARVCGRKFLDERDVNYFLFQDGKLPYVREEVKPPKIPPAKDSAEVWIAQFKVEQPATDLSLKELIEGSIDGVPIFYEVINNEVFIVDAKKDVRQLKLASYYLNKEFSKRGDLIFQAYCQSNSYSFSMAGKAPKIEELPSSKTDLPGVAFNRACGEHGFYMRSTKKR